MKAVVQRVSCASLTVDGRLRAEVLVPGGLVVLVGIEQSDTPDDRAWLADKIANLRIFPDAAGKMNLSITDYGGTILLVPNFTLAGDARKGRRPSFDNAMKPELAEPEFDALAAAVAALCPRVCRGVFRAHMLLALTNDGPVTITLDSNLR